MFALDGSECGRQNRDLPFFRSLAPGDQGADVLQLKRDPRGIR